MPYSSYNTCICIMSFGYHKFRHKSTWVRIRNLDHLSGFHEFSFVLPLYGLRKSPGNDMRGEKNKYKNETLLPLLHILFWVCFYLWFWFSSIAFCLAIKIWIVPKAVGYIIRMTSVLTSLLKGLCNLLFLWVW